LPSAVSNRTIFTLGTHFPFYDLEEKRIATKVDEKRKYFMRRKEKENIQMHGRILQEGKTVPIVWSALKKKKKKSC
jgi:hypothetical protein